MAGLDRWCTRVANGYGLQIEFLVKDVVHLHLVGGISYGTIRRETITCYRGQRAEFMIQPAIEQNGVATLQRLRALEHLYEQGYQDQVVDLTVHKLLERQVQKEEAQLAALAEELTTYEQRFALSSVHFFEKYQAGEMGDDADVFEWQVLYKMHQRLQNIT